MSFALIKELHEQSEDRLFIAENVFGLGEILSEDQEQLTENVKKFLSWARNLIDRPQITDDQIKRDPTVDAKEAKPYDVKNKADAIAKLAKTIAGLIYFKNQKVDGHDKQLIASKVQGDKKIDAYVEKFGVDKAMDIVKKITADIETKNRTYIKAMLKQIEDFYKINVVGNA